jgi:hypothetical protein
VRLLTAIASFSMTAIVASASWAVVVVDQEFLPASTPFNSNIGLSSNLQKAQTFTVGIDGSIVALDLRVRRQTNSSLPLLFDIRRIDNGLPADGDVPANILLSGSVDPSAIDVVGTPGSVLHIDLATPTPQVSVGERLAIVLRSLDPGNSEELGYIWSGRLGNEYVGGQSFGRSQFNDWGAVIDADLAFRTYMSVVPEPSSLLLAVSACAILCRRRRKLGRSSGDPCDSNY